MCKLSTKFCEDRLLCNPANYTNKQTNADESITSFDGDVIYYM